MCVRGTTGVVSLSSTELKGCNVTRGIVPFKISDDILRKFIFYTFQAPIAFDFIQQYTQGAALKQINIKDVKNIPISLPPSKSDIENIVNRLDAISHLCYKLKSNYFTTVTLCNDLKQSILKDIFG
jgi:type I restriction enzyme S subunit